MTDLKRLHSEICPSHNELLSTQVQYSVDGVQECKSSVVSLDAHTVNFMSCRNVYPLQCIKPINRYKYDEQSTLKSVIKDITSESILNSVICDNPKRAIFRNVLNHASLFACEYCESSAVYHICTITKKNLTEILLC